MSRSTHPVSWLNLIMNLPAQRSEKMNTITYHTWKARQQAARMVLLFAVALLLLPALALGTTSAPTRLVFITAASVASLAPPEHPTPRSHLTLLVQ